MRGAMLLIVALLGLPPATAAQTATQTAALNAVKRMYNHALSNDGTGTPVSPPGYQDWIAATSQPDPDPGMVIFWLFSCRAKLVEVWILAGEAAQLHDAANKTHGEQRTQLHQQGNRVAAEAKALHADAWACIKQAVLMTRIRDPVSEKYWDPGLY